jgi:hypothetical protein
MLGHMFLGAAILLIGYAAVTNIPQAEYVFNKVLIEGHQCQTFIKNKI